MDEREAMELIDDHRFVAFNVSQHARGRREIRIWRGCVESYLPGKPRSAKPKLDDVIAGTLPPLGIANPNAAFIRGADLARRVCFSRIMVALLIESGQLREIGKHSGNESPRVAWGSAAQFLRERAL